MRSWRRIMRLSVLRSLYDSGGIKQPPYELKGLVKALRAAHRQQVLRHPVAVVDVLLADLLDEVLRHRVATPVLHLIRVEAMDHFPISHWRAAAGSENPSSSGLIPVPLWKNSFHVVG